MAHNVKYSAALKNARLDQITAKIGASGLLRIYDGAQPASPDSAVTSQVSLNAILSGCTTMTDSSASTESHASFCAVAKPILWSAHDTGETILQVKEHNAAGAVLCGWGAAPHR